MAFTTLTQRLVFVRWYWLGICHWKKTKPLSWIVCQKSRDGGVCWDFLVFWKVLRMWTRVWFWTWHWNAYDTWGSWRSGSWTFSDTQKVLTPPEECRTVQTANKFHKEPSWKMHTDTQNESSFFKSQLTYVTLGVTSSFIDFRIIEKEARQPLNKYGFRAHLHIHYPVPSPIWICVCFEMNSLHNYFQRDLREIWIFLFKDWCSKTSSQCSCYSLDVIFCIRPYIRKGEKIPMLMLL